MSGISGVTSGVISGVMSGVISGVMSGVISGVTDGVTSSGFMVSSSRFAESPSPVPAPLSGSEGSSVGSLCSSAPSPESGVELSGVLRSIMLEESCEGLFGKTGESGSRMISPEAPSIDALSMAACAVPGNSPALDSDSVFCSDDSLPAFLSADTERNRCGPSVKPNAISAATSSAINRLTDLLNFIG